MVESIHYFRAEWEEGSAIRYLKNRGKDWCKGFS